MTDKANVVYLQLKFLPTYVRFGGQDGGEDDVGEPFQKGKEMSTVTNVTKVKIEDRKVGSRIASAQFCHIPISTKVVLISCSCLQ